jgi:hypothetical protein
MALDDLYAVVGSMVFKGPVTNSKLLLELDKIIGTESEPERGERPTIKWVFKGVVDATAQDKVHEFFNRNQYAFQKYEFRFWRLINTRSKVSYDAGKESRS